MNSYEIETNSLDSFDFYLSDKSADYVDGDSIKRHVKHPMVHNKIVRDLSRAAYNSNGIYANSIDYSVSAPNLDSILTYRNKENKNRAKKDEIKFVMDLINHKRAARDILRRLKIDGMYVGIFRHESEKDEITISDIMDGRVDEYNVMIQPLDLDYCKIVGFRNGASIAAFDLSYFDAYRSNGLLNEVKKFPRSFAKAYMEYRKDRNKRWHTLDYRKTIAVKARSDEEEPYGRPYGLSALYKMKIDEDYEDGQHKLIQELASSIYFLILPEGEKKGSCSLTKAQQDNTIDAFKNAVKLNTSGGSKAKISTLTLAPGSKLDRLTKDAALLKDTLSEENMKKISTAIGFATAAFNASSEGGASYSTLQVNIDLVLSDVFQLTDEIAKEFTRILNHFVGNTPRDHIEFSYLRTSMLNQNVMYDRAKELYTHGSGSLKMWIATAGFDPDSYMGIMDEEIEDGIYDKYKPHMTSFTATAEEVGAPEKDEGDLKPAGQIARNLGSNEQARPSTK